MIKRMEYSERRFYILALGLLTACMIGVFMFYMQNVVAFGSSLERFGKSLLMYFANIFGQDLQFPNGNESLLPPIVVPVLPQTFDIFSVKFAAWGNMLFNGENAALYWGTVGSWLVLFVSVIVMILPAFVLFLFLRKRLGKKYNQNHGQNTKPLEIYLRVAEAFRKVKNKVHEFIMYVKENRLYCVTLFILFLLASGVITLFFSLTGFLLYFSATFETVGIWRGIRGLGSDIALMFESMPVVVWLYIVYRILKKLCIDIANQKLMRNWAIDLKYGEELGVCTLICGLMRTGKSTLLTTFGLVLQTVFRNKANEKIKKMMLKYPHFPWSVLNDDLKKAIKVHDVYSLTSAKDWVIERKQFFNDCSKSSRIWGYDIERYPCTFDDCLKETDIWEALKTYAKLFFIYSADTSLMVSNYAIRDDAVLIDSGNYPLWDMQYLFRDSKRLKEISRGSHILDYDLLRLGKSMNKTKSAGSAEMGIFLNQEGGKERGNMLSHKKLNIHDVNANQLNDLIELKEKLAGHSANVDYFSFIRFLFDEQRPETLGADGREICDKIIYVDRNKKREKNALPFSYLFTLIHHVLYQKYENRIEQYSFRRGDMTLKMYLYLSMLSKVETAYARMVNRYGYTRMILEEESGKMNGKRKERKFYQINKIIYADRFATACYSSYFEMRSRRAEKGIIDYPEYEGSQAKWKELEKQKSYLIKDLKELL